LNKSYSKADKVLPDPDTYQEYLDPLGVLKRLEKIEQWKKDINIPKRICMDPSLYVDVNQKEAL
jgi:hypothetical protein